MHVDYSYYDEEEQCVKFRRGQIFTNALYKHETRTLDAWVSEIGKPYKEVIVKNILSIDFCD